MNTEEIFVTVVMCVYNTPKEYLWEAVNSILGQTKKQFELIIVDDASTVEGLYAGEPFADDRITIIKNEINRGPGYCRNVAFSRAKGKYIAIMDSDDISLPERLQKQVEFLEIHGEVAACGTWFQHFGEKHNTVKRVLDDPEYYRCCLLFGNTPTLLNPSVMLRKSTLDDYHIRYDVRLRKAEDYKMWVQLSKIAVCTNLSEVLLNYRVHKGQTSQRLRTAEVSEYDWIVWKEQFDAIGLEVSEEEEKMLRHDFRDSRVKPYAYYLWLEKLMAANEKSKVFLPEKLKKRVMEQWESKILNTKNPAVLVKLWMQLPKEQKQFLVKTEMARFRRKLGKGI